MKYNLRKSDRFGLIRPAVDAHTLGISALEQMLQQCGFAAATAGEAECQAASCPERPTSAAAIERWLRANRITVLGFSYRLDPQDGPALFERLCVALHSRGLMSEDGGPIRALYFAGLPQACRVVRQRMPQVAGVFEGDETPAQTLAILGIRAAAVPASMAAELAYDEALGAFGRDLVRKGGHLAVKPPGRWGYRGFGQAGDTLVARLRERRRRRLGPLMRAHVGPYLPDRRRAVAQFLQWTERLADAGHLDVLSIGTSQLTQSDFGRQWGQKPNGGGVPINSPQEYEAVWRAARPMLVRTYAGTRDVPALARMHERTIHIAWHALSLWWFCRLDGRGPYELGQNLQQHVETIRYIATTGKPLEANVAHHFAFRGADDVTYIVSSVLAARLAKRMGIRHFVLQCMLNTPKYTWGVVDLAKARATLRLVRELEDANFQVIFQPRGGLDYFSPDLDRAKAQLAAVTALMDDVEPRKAASPDVIHVVSYSEASHLADPDVVNESIQITRHALVEYRRLRRLGLVDDMSASSYVDRRTDDLLAQARAVLEAMEATIDGLYTPRGLYEAFAAGFMPVPYLWSCREEFPNAVKWRTRVVDGGVKVIDSSGAPLDVRRRMAQVRADAAAGRRG
jgi:hypothetical protein